MLKQFQDIGAPHRRVIEPVAGGIAMWDVPAPAHRHFRADAARRTERYTVVHQLMHKGQSEEQIVEVMMQDVQAAYRDAFFAYSEGIKRLDRSVRLDDDVGFRRVSETVG